MRINANYDNIRELIAPGDIIAFSGKGNASDIIKWATRSSVSHVAVVLKSKIFINNDTENDFFNEIIESTSVNGYSGVLRSRLSDKLKEYDGEAWWLPLSDTVKDNLNLRNFYDFLLNQDKKPYDLPQAINSSLDILDKNSLISSVTYNIEDFSRFFCSELVVAGLEAGGVINSINSSEVTPIDLCMFSIYQQNYYQIKGTDKDIRGYNSLPPDGWGE